MTVKIRQDLDEQDLGVWVGDSWLYDNEPHQARWKDGSGGDILQVYVGGEWLDADSAFDFDFID